MAVRYEGGSHENVASGIGDPSQLQREMEVGMIDSSGMGGILEQGIPVLPGSDGWFEVILINE